MKRGFLLPSSTKRRLTVWVGLVFLCSMAAAQLPHCQCGVFCSHGDECAPAIEPEAPESQEHGCCSSEKEVEAANPGASRDALQENGHGCDCEVELGTGDAMPATALPDVATSFDIQQQIAFQLVEMGHRFAGAGHDVAVSRRFNRGSPLSSPPAYLLNSVYII